MDVEGFGIRARLPRGWEGALRAVPLVDEPAEPRSFEARPFALDDADADTDAATEGDGPAADAEVLEPDEDPRGPAELVLAPVLHAGTFALPADRGDFGSGAVELMREDDSFVALLEYGPEEVGTALYAAQGLPRRLDPRTFSSRSLQRQISGQAGWQHFFTENGRPFCLYIVLGDRNDANLQVRRIEQLLAEIVIEPAS
ncbi:hypothetical protein FTX61_18880 [Nitriliruptoraceae bacterium ZYF776]|nr:hypothetical protein [Profundirhabdus halotolerans]